MLSLLACGPGPRGGDDDEGCVGICSALGYQACNDDGTYDDPVACQADEVCVTSVGCAVCEPGANYCAGEGGNEVWACNDAGDGGEFVSACPADAVCSNGACKTPCEQAADNPSNVGCDFWAVDLDNEQFESIFGGGFGGNDAAAAQFAVVIANNNDEPATVQVRINGGQVGQPLAEQVIQTNTVPARGVLQLNLPQREVDGTMGQNAGYAPGTGAGTHISPHAFHITTTLPVVAYQFNPIIQQFSNDASILIPIQALGTHYSVLGWPTANPCGQPPGEFGHQPSIPDHTAITVVATEDNTQVTINPTHAVTASGSSSGLVINQTAAGQPITLTLNRYDVANLESFQPTGDLFDCISLAMDYSGDFTGSVVTSTKPVVVFTSLERGIGFGGAEPTPSPNWEQADGICCTDHFEEQLFPTTALGREYAIARSPVRSTDPSWKEPDIFRVVGTRANTQITTNLPGGDAAFTLGEGQQRTFASSTGFTLSASHAVQIGQVLVPQHFIPDGFIGDPTLVMIPAAEQHRKDYVFLVPTTFQDNYMVLAKPTGAAVTLDGMPLASEASCYGGSIGMVAGVAYDQVTCSLSEGPHTVAADVAFGLTVFGYYNVGSYGFAGGSDVKIINPIE